MKIYLISVVSDYEWDFYDSAVVCAESEEKARLIHPGRRARWSGKNDNDFNWARSNDVDVKLIGVAENSIKKGVICASFNAG